MADFDLGSTKTRWPRRIRDLDLDGGAQGGQEDGETGRADSGRSLGEHWSAFSQ